MPEENFEEQLFSDENLKTPEDNLEQVIDESVSEIESETSGDEFVTVAGGEKEETVEEQPKQEEKAEITPSFYQTEYQKAMELLKQINPEIHSRVHGQLKADRKGEETRPSKEQSDTDDDGIVTIDDIRKAVREEYKAVQTESELMRNLETEYVNANTAFENFCTSSNIGQEQIDAAYKEVSALNIDVDKPGGYKALASAMMKEIQFQAMQNHLQSKTVEASAQAADKANTIKTIAQPESGALPEPKPLTKEQKLLKAMREAGSSEAAREMFE